MLFRIPRRLVYNINLALTKDPACDEIIICRRCRPTWF